MEQDNPDKLFYRVGEVSQIAGVESYVLRYWEKMFPQLSPEKDDSGQRVYTKSDIEVVKHIKNLLYEERYTIDGARRKLRQEHKGSKDNQKLLRILREVRNDLQRISAILEKE